MKGSDVIAALKKKLGASTNRALAQRLGVTVHAIGNWKNRKQVTVRQIAGLVNRAGKAGAIHLQTSAIRPLVEFFRIEVDQSSATRKHSLFRVSETDGSKHPYLEGLRNELDDSHGVYIFFDSRGQAIYAGKARRQSLWKEMNLAFNRKRESVQKIMRVKHPSRRRNYRTSEEKTRQIREQAVPLHELAAYFSAYAVTDGMIHEVESLLVRSFANDLLNIRMERFGQQRAVSAARRKANKKTRKRTS